MKIQVAGKTVEVNDSFRNLSETERQIFLAKIISEIESKTTPEKPTKPEQKEDELENYSKNVQSRIKKLTEKYRKEERDREEAVRISQSLLEENKELKKKVDSLD